MKNAMSIRKNWMRKFCSIIIGLIVAGSITYFIPMLKKSKDKEVKNNLIVKNENSKLEKEKEIFYGEFEKYKVTIMVKLKKDMDVKASINKIKKACSFIEMDDLIEKIILMEVKAVRTKNKENVEYDIELDSEK